MTNSIIKFEALMTKERTVIRKVTIKDAHCIDYNPQSSYIYMPLGRHYRVNDRDMSVYSEMIDESLNYTNVTELKDDVSILYIYELSNDICTKPSPKNMGINDLKNAVLVVEYRIISKIQSITEKDESTINEWYYLAETVNIGDLQSIINHIMNDYNHDYGSYVHAVAACSVATAWACGKELSGFQASCVGLEFLMHWTYNYVKSGISIRNWDNMLYPQYEDCFDKVIPKNIWKNLQKEAQSRVADFYDNADTNRYIVPKVIQHQKSIADGNPPFGYSIEDSSLS